LEARRVGEFALVHGNDCRRDEGQNAERSIAAFQRMLLTVRSIPLSSPEHRIGTAATPNSR
jgi:hypothetical protein